MGSTNPSGRRKLWQALSLGAMALLVAAAVAGGVAYYRGASAQSTPYVPLAKSYLGAPAHAQMVGAHSASSQLTVTLALNSSNAAALDNLIAGLYNPSSPQYHHWLPRGEYNRVFGPSAGSIAAVKAFLKQNGLRVISSPSPFLVRAVGTTAQVETAFRTHISDYVSSSGVKFFANSAAIQVPASLAAVVGGVSGLANTVRERSNYITTAQAAKHAGKATPAYGAGPGGSGFTPSQLGSIYDATGAYAAGIKGQGTTLAVFELSGYRPSDISLYEHQFFGSSENVPLVDVNVDGGPITPVCPLGDICFPGPDYSGDIEVEADLETQIAIAPKVNKILVYNAPNDFFGVTEIDEYFQIANDDAADSISSSWALCEQDAGSGIALAEYAAFRQMAVQGQSMFGSSGDSGAWSCLRGSGNPALAVLDPSSQPYVTAVGGTSFEGYDPGKTTHPSYPNGSEEVWNVLGLCNPSNILACLFNGAGGGGDSVFWGQPKYQTGPGVTNSLSTKAPTCILAAANAQCREVPDISANADEFTPYAEFCRGFANTNSTCASFALGLNPIGWFGIGGTSLSSPLWSAIIALTDSSHHTRLGQANWQLYRLFRTSGSYNTYFHDITGKNQQATSNGFYPTTPNYDQATGIGAPRITALVKDL